jgi:lysophospholipase L1-like esterase
MMGGVRVPRIAGGLTVLLVSLGLAGGNEGPPLVIGCAGDSLMRPIPVHLRRLLPPATPRFVIHEWARGGLGVAAFRNFLGRQRERWSEARPDVVLVQLGTNDVAPLLEGRLQVRKFKSDLTAVVRRFGEFRTSSGGNARVILATVPYFADDPSNLDKNRVIQETVNPAIRDVARRAGARLADSFAVLKGRPDLYDPDGVHPNAAGEAALAENWIRSIRESKQP